MKIQSLLCFWILAEYLIVMRADFHLTVAYTLLSATPIPDLSNIIFKNSFYVKTLGEFKANSQKLRENRSHINNTINHLLLGIRASFLNSLPSFCCWASLANRWVRRQEDLHWAKCVISHKSHIFFLTLWQSIHHIYNFKRTSWINLRSQCCHFIFTSWINAHVNENEV